MGVDIVYCTKCGNKVSGDDSFCTHCGFCLVDNDNVVSCGQKNSDNVAFIMGFLALIFFWVPVVSIPLAVVCISKGKEYNLKEKANSASVKFGFVSIGLSIIYIVFIMVAIFLFYFYVDDVKNYNIDETIEEYYYTDQVVIKGYKWLDSDNFMLYLNQDNSYIWYFDDKDFERGTYEVYVGKDAIEYIINNLSDYKFDLDKQLDLFKDNSKMIDNYCLLILNCNNKYVDGKYIFDDNEITPYYGFYDGSNDTLSLINMKNDDSVLLVRNGKVDEIDNNI